MTTKTEDFTPEELAAAGGCWQEPLNRALDNLIRIYREVTGDGEYPPVVDLFLFAESLPHILEAGTVGGLLACAIARLADDGADAVLT